jgi:hypothetical protein
MITVTAAPYVAAGIVAAVTLAPFGGYYLLYRFLRKEVERCVETRIDAEVVLVVLERRSAEYHLKTMQPSVAEVRLQLEKIQKWGTHATDDQADRQDRDHRGSALPAMGGHNGNRRSGARVGPVLVASDP